MALPSNIEKQIRERFPTHAYHNGVRIEVEKFAQELISEYASEWKVKCDELNEENEKLKVELESKQNDTKRWCNKAMEAANWRIQLQREHAALKDKAQKLADVISKSLQQHYVDKARLLAQYPQLAVKIENHVAEWVKEAEEALSSWNEGKAQTNIAHIAHAMAEEVSKDAKTAKAYLEGEGVPPMRPEDHEQVEINKVAGMPEYEASFQSGYSAGHDVGYEKGKREGAIWVKANVLKIEYNKKYYAKWRNPEGIPDVISTGWFQKSDGTFFWNEQGYVPVGADERDSLFLLDESPSLSPAPSGKEDAKNILYVIWQCHNPDCNAQYTEYVNGCPKCATGDPGGSYKVSILDEHHPANKKQSK